MFEGVKNFGRYLATSVPQRSLGNTETIQNYRNSQKDAKIGKFVDKMKKQRLSSGAINNFALTMKKYNISHENVAEALAREESGIYDKEKVAEQLQNVDMGKIQAREKLKSSASRMAFIFGLALFGAGFIVTCTGAFPVGLTLMGVGGALMTPEGYRFIQRLREGYEAWKINNPSEVKAVPEAV